MDTNDMTLLDWGLVIFFVGGTIFVIIGILIDFDNNDKQEEREYLEYLNEQYDKEGIETFSNLKLKSYYNLLLKTYGLKLYYINLLRLLVGKNRYKFKD